VSLRPIDARLRVPQWQAGGDLRATRTRSRLLLVANLAATAWYFAWLLEPGRAGNPVLYGALLVAEAFNLVQALGFWWTCANQRVRAWRPPPAGLSADVFIPTYNEPVEVVEPVVAAARRMRGSDVRVHLLDDGRREAMRALALRHGVNYVTRPDNKGAKAGNINHALTVTSADVVAVFDCDHVPDSRFLERTAGHFTDRRVAFVQTPQYYANADEGGVAAASWSQQALFFGAIARGKDGLGAIFCCGTNVVFRRTALESVGGFPHDSVTEDFALSIRLHEAGWRSAYVAEVLARGLAPEDMASYVGQQQRWARGCLSAIPAALRAKLPWRLKLQYLLSSLYFLSGWTLLVYMTLPIVAVLTGVLPVDVASADEYLLHFAPYWGLCLLSVAVAGGGVYTFPAFTLWSASFWISIEATYKVVLRRVGGFVVTPKQGAAGRQPRAVLPALVVAGVLLAACAAGLAREVSPATMNNVAFAALHLAVLLRGAWPALAGRATGAVAPRTPAVAPVQERAA